MVFRHHKPMSTMYGDNYLYGTSLYAPTLNDTERNYRSSLSRTHVRSDRGDLGTYTFAGSHIHGGTPAAERVQGTKVNYNPHLYAPQKAAEYGKGYYDHLRATSPPPRARSSNKMADLYAPIDPTEYHPHYYDHLRASSPEPRAKKGPIPYYDLVESPYYTRPSKMASDYDYTYDSTKKTSSSDYSHTYNYSSYDDTGKKTTTKKTTTTEYWVPLTTHIYNTPYHTYFYRSTPFSSYTYRTTDDLYNYNFLDDYKRYSKTTKTSTSKNVDALDLSVSKSYEKSDYSHFTQKCQEIQSQLSEVNKWIHDAETKLKTEVVNTRSKIQSELADVTSILDETARYSDDLHKVIRKQAKQISSLNKEYDDVNRHLVDISDVLEKSRSRCQTLQSDLSSVQSVIEMVDENI